MNSKHEASSAIEIASGSTDPDDETPQGRSVADLEDECNLPAAVPQWIPQHESPSPAGQGKHCIHLAESFKLWLCNDLSNSTKFALRIMTSATLASLFTLLPDAASASASATAHNKDDRFVLPESLWIVVTAIIVSWQASPDIASVSQKTIQRLIGTILGSFVALVLGGISLLFDHGSTSQSLYLLSFLAIGTFVSAKVASQYGYRGHYSAVLGCVTFGIVLLAFYDIDASDGFRIGVFRVVNICIGSILGGTVSLVFFPMSTMALIESKVEGLIHETGSTARSVLQGASNPPPSLIYLVRKQRQEDDSHQRYMKSLAEWQNTRQLFDLLPFDPFHRRLSPDRQRLFWEIFRLRLGRIMRIQATLVVMDGLNRCNLHNVQQDALLARIGDSLEALLGNSSEDQRTQAAHRLIMDDLPAVRQLKTAGMQHPRNSYSEDLSRLDSTVSADAAETQQSNVGKNDTNDEDEASVLLQGDALSQALLAFENPEDDDPSANNVPNFFSRQHSSILFYHLLEFVIIRALRLERYWTVTEREWKS